MALQKCMELKIINEDKNMIEIEIKDETHTFCNVLKDEIVSNEDVAYAAYSIKHPLVSNPVLIVKTNDGKARKVLEKSVSSLKSKIKTLRAEIKKL